MSIESRLITYGEAGETFEGFMAWDNAQNGSRPAVLIAHTIRGRTPFEESKAIALAEMGYVGFALDVYGQAKIGEEGELARANMNALLADRVELQRRLTLSLATMSQQDEVDPQKQAAIGYCFGGLSVLDLARIGADVLGVVGFHGLFHPPGNTEGNTIAAKVLALHGWDDPLATPDSVVALAEEMTAMKADWQLHGYGHTTHAFTYPAANDPEKGTVYNADADRRSWQAMQNFISELFE